MAPIPNQNHEPGDPEFDDSVHTRKATEPEVAYRDGYVSGKSEKELEESRRLAAQAGIRAENARLRTNDGVASGLVLGIVFVLVAAVIGGIFYFAGNSGNSPQAPVSAPDTTSPEAPPRDTTIIERTIERTQEVAPAPPAIELPDVNVDVTPPSAAPAPPAAAPAPPAAAPAPPAAPEASDQPAAGESQPPTEPSAPPAP